MSVTYKCKFAIGDRVCVPHMQIVYGIVMSVTFYEDQITYTIESGLGTDTLYTIPEVHVRKLK